MLSYVPQPFPFYTSTDHQLFRQDYCGNVPKFKNIVLMFDDGAVTPTFEMRIPRFQIKRAKTGAGITSFLVKSLTGTTVLTLPTTGFELADLDVDGTYEAVICNTGWEFCTGTTAQYNTYYYFQVSDGTNTWYSEPFYSLQVDTSGLDAPTDGCTDTVRLKWANTCDIQGANPDGSLGGIVSQNFAGFDMFIEADPGKPEYNYEEDGENDANGVFVPDMRRSKKTWELEFIGTEATADCCNAIPLFDTITMYYNNSESVTINEVKVETEWIQSCEAKIRLKLSAYYLMRRGCC